MVECKFWAKGSCRNGNNCRFEHIGPPGREAVSGGGGRGRNAFDALQNTSANPIYSTNYQNQNTYAGRGQTSYGGRLGVHQPGPQGGPAAPQLPFALSSAAMIADLSTELPQWILSAYGPGLKAPVQLFGGEEREKSFEEMRLNHYMLRAQGQEALAARQQDELIQKAAAQNQNALNNVDEAIQYVLRGEHEHPNRIDIAEQYTKGIISPMQPPQGPAQAPLMSGPQAVNAFGQPIQQPGVGAFGTGQSGLGQKPSPFGAPPPLGANQAFVQPGFGVNPLAQQPFGQQPPQPAIPSAFGQPSQQPSVSPFGATTGFQQNAPSPFIQPQAPQQPRPSVFGQQQPPQPGALGPFGAQQPPQPAAPSPFAQQPQHAPFGQAPVNPLVAQAGNVPGFGGLTPTGPRAVNPFAPIAQQQQQQQPPLDPQALSPFAPITQQQQQPPFSSQAGIPPAGGLVADPSPYPPNSSIQHAHPSTYSTRDASNRLTMFKGKRVVYKDDVPGFQNPDGSWEKIWFPDGPPAFNETTELPEERYDQETKNAYQKFRETGQWEGGKLPLLPPRREWTKWDF